MRPGVYGHRCPTCLVPARTRYGFVWGALVIVLIAAALTVLAVR